MTEKSGPGVSREHRISDAGLQRLQKQLACGARISKPVLTQWIRRYGDAARKIIRSHQMYSAEFDDIE
jgi:hypothetical protein